LNPPISSQALTNALRFIHKVLRAQQSDQELGSAREPAPLIFPSSFVHRHKSDHILTRKPIPERWVEKAEIWHIEITHENILAESMTEGSKQSSMLPAGKAGPACASNAMTVFPRNKDVMMLQP